MHEVLACQTLIISIECNDQVVFTPPFLPVLKAIYMALTVYEMCELSCAYTCALRNLSKTPSHDIIFNLVKMTLYERTIRESFLSLN